jgi:hypothetical protein
VSRARGSPSGHSGNADLARARWWIALGLFGGVAPSRDDVVGGSWAGSADERCPSVCVRMRVRDESAWAHGGRGSRVKAVLEPRALDQRVHSHALRCPAKGRRAKVHGVVAVGRDRAVRRRRETWRGEARWAAMLVRVAARLARGPSRATHVESWTVAVTRRDQRSGRGGRLVDRRRFGPKRARPRHGGHEGCGLGEPGRSCRTKVRGGDRGSDGPSSGGSRSTRAEENAARRRSRVHRDGRRGVNLCLSPVSAG